MNDRTKRLATWLVGFGLIVAAYRALELYAAPIAALVDALAPWLLIGSLWLSVSRLDRLEGENAELRRHVNWLRNRLERGYWHPSQGPEA